MDEEQPFNIIVIPVGEILPILHRPSNLDGWIQRPKSRAVTDLDHRVRNQVCVISIFHQTLMNTSRKICCA